MSPEELNVRKAIADVELIRRVLDQAKKNDSPDQTVGLFGVTLTANIILQSFALAGAVLLLVVELATSGSITQTLLLGATLPDLRILGIGLMAGILIALVILLYFVIWRAARTSGEEFNAYIVRNFRYARLLSYLSDLLLKFAAAALIMLAGHPEWIPPLLLAFTGDYLVQGRLFTLPTRLAVILGAICIAIGLYQFLTDIQTLVLPLAVFTAVAAISTGRLMRLHRKQAHEAA
jgi:hypothetical protein